MADIFTDLGVESSFLGSSEELESFFSEKPIEKKEEKKLEEKKEGESKTPYLGENPKLPEEDEDVLGKFEDEKEEKEEEKKEEIKEEKKEEEKKEGEEESKKILDLEAFTADLFELQVLTKDEDDNGKSYKTPDELLERFNREKQKGATQWLEGFLSQYGEDRRELFDAIYFNGVDPKEYLPVYNSVQDLRNVDLTIESVQKQVFREFFRRTKLDESTIEKKLQQSVDYGNLEEDAKIYHPQILSQDEQRLKELEEKEIRQRADTQRIETEYKQSIQSIIVEKLKGKEINGFPINEQDARKVADTLITKKYKAPNGDLLTDFDKLILDTKRPENHWKRVLIALLANNNFDFSKIEKKAISKESNTLFNSLVDKTKKTSVIKKETSAAGNSIWV